jgi:hypothetical protein
LIRIRGYYDKSIGSGSNRKGRSATNPTVKGDSAGTDEHLYPKFRKNIFTGYVRYQII